MKKCLVTVAMTGAMALAHGQALEKELVIASTGGTMEKNLVQFFYGPFEKAKGVQVIPAANELPDQWAKAQAMNKAGKMEFVPVDFDLRETLDRTMKPFQFSFRQKGLGLSVRICREVPDILHGDADRIMRAVTSKFEITPSRKGRITAMSCGARPRICSASLPTATSFPPARSTAATDGSFSTMPRSFA